MTGEKASSISGSRTIEEMADFWDTHSLADHEDQTYEVDVYFSPAARRRCVNIEPDLFDELRRAASERRITTQTLVNLWLRQRIDGATP